MHIGHKIEIKPTKIQERLLRQSCGTARFTYNWALAEWQKQYEAGLKPSGMALKKQFNAIKKDQFPWICPCCGSFHDRDANDARNIVTQAFTLDGTLNSKIPQAMGELTLLDSRCIKAAG